MAITTQLATLETSKKPVTSSSRPTTSTNVTWVSSLSTLYTNALTAIISAFNDIQTQVDNVNSTQLTLEVGSIALSSSTVVTLESANTTISYDLNVSTIDLQGSNVSINTPSLVVQSLPVETITYNLLPTDFVRIVRNNVDLVVPVTLFEGITFPPYVPNTYDWVSDGDTNSIIDYMGGSSPYVNPVTLGSLVVTASGEASGKEAINLFDNDDGYWTGSWDANGNSGNQFVMLEFKAHPVKPNLFVLKANDYDQNPLTNFITGVIFQGSNDGTEWDDLHTITAPTTPYYNSGEITASESYKYLRFYKPNATTYWVMSAIQIYGEY